MRTYAESASPSGRVVLGDGTTGTGFSTHDLAATTNTGDIVAVSLTATDNGGKTCSKA